MNYKNLALSIYKSVEKLSDEMIMKELNSKRLQPRLNDWQNWGKNIDKMFAEVAYSRNLIA